MRRTLLIIVWLLVPVVLLAYHFGPGQSRLSQERAAAAITKARALEQSDQWADAVQAWADALAATPESQSEARFRLRLAHANARMYVGELPEAMEAMDTLLTDARAAGADAMLEREIRGSLASAHYYAAWLMRLESAPSEEWLVQAENARQHFRLLAEQVAGTSAAENYEKNLEATIRLEQMDLSELEGLPLPKCCSGCKNVSQKCRSQCKSRSENKGDKPPEDARGAGFNPIPKGGS
jgi:tetratricopeptide (TPR) repeat protein